MYYLTIGDVNYANEIKLEQMNQTSMAFSLHHPSLNPPLSLWRRDGLDAWEVGKNRQLEQLKIPKNTKRRQNVS
jgi:hypothetical protein